MKCATLERAAKQAYTAYKVNTCYNEEPMLFYDLHESEQEAWKEVVFAVLAAAALTTNKNEDEDED